MDTHQWIQLAILVVLIFLSAFFSSAETALTTVNKIRIRTLIEENNKSAIILDKVISDTEKMLTAILIGNNIVNISSSALATVFATELFGNKSIGAMTGILTIVILIFGEITPKTIATIHAEEISLKYSKIIYALMIITTPIIFIVGHLSAFFLKILGVDKNKNNKKITETELRTIVNVSHEEGIIEKEEKEIISNVFDIGEVEAKDIMIPRVDITAVSLDADYIKLLEIFKIDKPTRIPVYKNSIDNIVGIINMKDVLLYNKNDKFDISNYLREPLYIYEGKNISELLAEMKKTSANLSIVLDEYGVVVGLITLEDILEEIVGDIKDEYDICEENNIKKINSNEYSIDASMNIDDVNEALDIELESENNDSIGGILLEKLDRIPLVGEKIYLKNYMLVAQNIEKNRITRVRLIINREI